MNGHATYKFSAAILDDLGIQRMLGRVDGLHGTSWNVCERPERGDFVVLFRYSAERFAFLGEFATESDAFAAAERAMNLQRA